MLSLWNLYYNGVIDPVPMMIAIFFMAWVYIAAKIIMAEEINGKMIAFFCGSNRRDGIRSIRSPLQLASVCIRAGNTARTS